MNHTVACGPRRSASCAGPTWTWSASRRGSRNPRGSKPHQQTTAIEAAVAPEEAVTITDPRHPLFGQTLPLMEIANKQYLGRCCVVLLREGVDLFVPLAATDRSPEPLALYPLPLDLISVRQLLVTYGRIISHPAEGTDNEPTPRKNDTGRARNQDGAVSVGRGGTADSAGAALDTPDFGAAAGGISDAGAPVPQPGQYSKPRPRKGGAR
jgi:hypothetical protein